MTRKCVLAVTAATALVSCGDKPVCSGSSIVVESPRGGVVAPGESGTLQLIAGCPSVDPATVPCKWTAEPPAPGCQVTFEPSDQCQTTLKVPAECPSSTIHAHVAFTVPSVGDLENSVDVPIVAPDKPPEPVTSASASTSSNPGPPVDKEDRARRVELIPARATAHTAFPTATLGSVPDATVDQREDKSYEVKVAAGGRGAATAGACWVITPATPVPAGHILELTMRTSRAASYVFALAEAPSTKDGRPFRLRAKDSNDWITVAIRPGELSSKVVSELGRFCVGVEGTDRESPVTATLVELVLRPTPVPFPAYQPTITPPPTGTVSAYLRYPIPGPKCEGGPNDCLGPGKKNW